MREKTLMLLGLMRKASAVEIGETNAGAAVRSGKAKLLLLASDASDNARGRAEGFFRGHSTLSVDLPFTKDEISAHVGVNGCSMLAITDMGFANAFMKDLCQLSDSYLTIAREVTVRFEKAEKRKKESKAHEKNLRTGKRRTKV